MSARSCFAVGMRKAAWVTAGVTAGADGPRPPREQRPTVEPRPPRDVLPPRADPPREEPQRPPRPRTCAEPPHGAVQDGAEPEGDQPTSVAAPGDEEPVGAAPDGVEPGGDAPSHGTGGHTPPGEAGLFTPGASPEGPGALSAGGDDPAGLSQGHGRWSHEFVRGDQSRAGPQRHGQERANR